jgi:hypothetical protein
MTSFLYKQAIAFAGASDARPNDWRVVMVTIISSRREVFVAGDGQRDGFRFAPHYLVQNVARFLQLITERRSRRLAPVEYRLAVCSVGEEMTPEESYLAQLVPVFRNAEAAKVGVHSAKRFDPWFDQMAWRYVCTYRQTYVHTRARMRVSL